MGVDLAYMVVTRAVVKVVASSPRPAPRGGRFGRGYRERAANFDGFVLVPGLWYPSRPQPEKIWLVGQLSWYCGKDTAAGELAAKLKPYLFPTEA